MGKARNFIKEQCVCAEEEFELIKKKKRKNRQLFPASKENTECRGATESCVNYI